MRRTTLLLAVCFATGLSSGVTAAAPIFVRSFSADYLCNSRGIALSPSGELFVSGDCEYGFMHMFTASGDYLGHWNYPNGFQSSVTGVAVDASGNLFVADNSVSRVYKLTSSGVVLTSWPTPSGAIDVTVNSTGDVLVLEAGPKQIQKFTNDGVLLQTFGSAGLGTGQLQEPMGMGLDASGRLYVADRYRLRILRFRADGSFDMEFKTPHGMFDVAVGPDGLLYATRGDAYLEALIYSPEGTLLENFTTPNGLGLAWYIIITPTGTIYISELGGRISMFQIDQTTSVARTTFGRLKAMYR